MLDMDLVISFLVMILLFVRQIQILKEENRLNYSPIIVGVGAISSTIHFIINPEIVDTVLLFRESLFPFVISLFLFLIMNVIHQTKESEYSIAQDIFRKNLISEVNNLKQNVYELEKRVDSGYTQERVAQEKIVTKFQQDIKALDTISVNQARFLEKFEEMEIWHKSVSKSFKHFTDVEMPELDNIIHKHIDIFRITEQDHYNHLKKMLEDSFVSSDGINENIENLKSDIDSIKTISDGIANTITDNIITKLSDSISMFENEVLALKSHTQKIETSLSENDNIIGSIREESELVMKQMVLTSSKMDDIDKQNSKIYDIQESVTGLIESLNIIKKEYDEAQKQLRYISKEFQVAENDQIKSMKIQIENLSETLAIRIDESLAKLHEHYHIADEDISQSVQLLAKRAKLKSGYDI